jgi:hypothetical protein
MNNNAFTKGFTAQTCPDFGLAPRTINNEGLLGCNSCHLTPQPLEKRFTPSLKARQGRLGNLTKRRHNVIFPEVAGEITFARTAMRGIP